MTAPFGLRSLILPQLLALLLVGSCQSVPAVESLSYPDQVGRVQRPLEPTDGRTHVLIFVTIDCPIANGYAAEVQSIAADFESRKVDFFLVHVDPTISRDAAETHAREFGYSAPSPEAQLRRILDPAHELVRATGAELTPESVVITPSGFLAYRGRIDDLYPALGRKRASVTHRDLRDALESVLAGQPVSRPRTRTIGCLITVRE